MNSKKILLILILLLSVVIVGEVYYLFFFQRAESKSLSSQPSSTKVEEKVQSVPSPIPSPTEDPNQAYKEGLFDSLRTLRKGMVSSSTLTYVLKGSIERIDYLSVGEKKGIAVTIKADNGDVDSFRIPGTDLVTVIDASNSKVDLFTIKQNDQVAITIQFDMIKIDYQSIVIQIL